jgi:hypothetical protein
MTEKYYPALNIISEDKFIPSTIVLKGYFNCSIDTNVLTHFLFIDHKFDKDNKRIKLISGSRKNIDYYGPEGAVIFIANGSKKTKRGIRSGAMNNMISSDIQLGGKNIHVKISQRTLTSVGTPNIKSAGKVIDKYIEHMTNLQKILIYSNSLSVEEKEKNIEWLLNKLKDFPEGTREQDLEELKIPNDMNEKFIRFILKYYNDYDDLKYYEIHIRKLLNHILLKNNDLDIKCTSINVYNSVYHNNVVKTDNFKMPLHKLSLYLLKKGFETSWHNVFNDGLNICFDIENKKEGLNKENKFYKHRFTIYTTSEIRQSSPSFREESYKYYLILVKAIEHFFQTEDIDFKRYLKTDVKCKKNLKILMNMANEI